MDSNRHLIIVNVREMAVLLVIVGTVLSCRLALAKADGGAAGIGIRVGDGHDHRHHHRRHYHPGKTTHLDWEDGVPDIEACRKLENPLFLYIYDRKVDKVNHTARYFERNIFSSEKVKIALEGFTCVKAARSDKTWPLAFRNAAARGAAVFLITCDGVVHKSWRKDFRPATQELISAARMVAARNPASLARWMNRDKAQKLIPTKRKKEVAVANEKALAEAPKDAPKK